MRQRKKEIKGIILVIIFVVLIFFSRIPASNDLNPEFGNKEDPILFKEDNKDSPLSSSLNVTDFITGLSVNQTVRVYMNNKSSSINNQNGYFEIAAPTDNANLSSGLFEFNFGNNFTTDYIIENNKMQIDCKCKNSPFTTWRESLMLFQGSKLGTRPARFERATYGLEGRPQRICVVFANG